MSRLPILLVILVLCALSGLEASAATAVRTAKAHGESRLRQENPRYGPWDFRTRLLWEVKEVQGRPLTQADGVWIQADGSVVCHDSGSGLDYAFDREGGLLSAVAGREDAGAAADFGRPQELGGLLYRWQTDNLSGGPDAVGVDISTPEGEYLFGGELTLPAAEEVARGIRGFALGADRLYALTADQEGRHILAAYRVVLPPAPGRDGQLVRPLRYAEDLAVAVDSLRVLLTQVAPETTAGRPLALITPHYWPHALAVGARGFARLQGQRFRRVVLVCNSHRGGFPGLAVAPFDAWELPQGRLQLDRELAEALVDGDPRINFDGRPHYTDHTLEMVLPCLQEVLAGDFTIVPVLFGNSYDIGRDMNDDYKILAGLLDELLGPDDLLVVSNDMTHFYPGRQWTIDNDQAQLGLIGAGDLEGLIGMEQRLAATPESAGKILDCAIDGIKTALVLQRLRGGGDIDLLGYDLTGADWNNEKFCGFASILFTTGEGR